MIDAIKPNVPAIASRVAILGADMTIPPVAVFVFTPRWFLASDSYGCWLIEGEAVTRRMSLIYINRGANLVHGSNSTGQHLNSPIVSSDRRRTRFPARQMPPTRTNEFPGNWFNG
jgi:hypothetical protein